MEKINLLKKHGKIIKFQIVILTLQNVNFEKSLFSASEHSNNYIPQNLKWIGRYGRFDYALISQSGHVRLYICTYNILLCIYKKNKVNFPFLRTV